MKHNVKDKQPFEIRAIKINKHKTAFDFFVDRQQLSKKLGIDRFDMAYCDFDLDTFEVDNTKFPNYDRKQINTNAVSQLLGNSKATGGGLFFGQCSTKKKERLQCFALQQPIKNSS